MTRITLLSFFLCLEFIGMSNKLAAADITSIWKENTVITISSDIDLKGEKVKIPNGCTLQFECGMIKNGTLDGSDTKIRIKKSGPVFSNVIISGSWDIPVVKSSFFEDEHELNVLKQVFSLISESKQNKIFIGKGAYPVTRENDSEGILNVKSNTDINIKGRIIVEPNNYDHYYVLNIQNAKNVNIAGGEIIGDRKRHIGTIGEWGHGIFVWGNSENVSIRNTKIRDCWGDGVAIGRSDPSKAVYLDGLSIKNCRRNGISVISCDGGRISNCRIEDINGTAPEYAVDIEPNSIGYVNDVVLCKLKIRGKSGVGLPIASVTDNHFIRNIEIIESDIRVEKRCISVDGAEGITIRRNYLESRDKINIPLVIDHESKEIKILGNKIIKLLQEKNRDVPVVYADPCVEIANNMIEGKNCTAIYCIKSDQVIRNNKINSCWGITRIKDSLIENNDYRGTMFLTNVDNRCRVSNNKVRK